MCDRNYIADPEQWCNCFKVAGNGPPGLWRTVYPADPEAPEDAAKRAGLLNELRSTAADPARAGTFMPGSSMIAAMRAIQALELPWNLLPCLCSLGI